VSDSAPSVEVLSAISTEDGKELSTLLAQLSSTAVFDPERFTAVVASETTSLLVARVDGRVVGMATLAVVALPSGRRGHVEDVVVDESMRGRGIARLLLTRVIELATEKSVRSLDLTSRPSRGSALRLYESVGFVRRDTNVLRYTPSAAGSR
jgi:ribosomal protein S18 acetylase RimI-like enzyme